MTLDESLHEVLQSNGRLPDLFYGIFFTRCPAAERHFRGVNMTDQHILLTMALMVMERHHAHGYAATEMYLKYLGTKHHTRGIPKELFPPFRDALLEALRQFHADRWNSALSEQWATAIDRAVVTMFEGYATHYTV